jgi:hypothetical protein
MMQEGDEDHGQYVIHKMGINGELANDRTTSTASDTFIEQEMEFQDTVTRKTTTSKNKRDIGKPFLIS